MEGVSMYFTRKELLELLSRAISFYSCVVLCGALLLVYAAKRKLSKER